MAKMHGKPIFVGYISLVRDAPRFHIAPVYEIEHPFRLCEKALYTRLWKTHAFVIGLWRKSDLSEQELLLRAVKGRMIGPENGAQDREDSL